MGDADDHLALDLAAAELRADEIDVRVLLDALAIRLEEALPRAASVRRRKVGRFGAKRTEVAQIALTLADEQFELANDDSGLRCTRNKVVRGITLRREELALPQWIAALISSISSAGELSEKTRTALEGLVR